MNLALNAKLCKDRHPVQAFFQIRHDAIVVSVEQPVFVVPWTMVMPDRIGVLFLIDPDQSALLLHADIARHLFVIADDRKLAVQRFEFRHRLCNKIVVRH